MLRLTKTYRFSASHRLHSQRLSAAENARVFGKCNNPQGHGHNYILSVSVSGEPDPSSGLLLSRSRLDALVDRTVLAGLDYTHLNTGVEEFREIVPTTENLSLLIHRRLSQAWEQEFGRQSPRLDRVRVEETARNFFEVTGKPAL